MVVDVFMSEFAAEGWNACCCRQRRFESRFLWSLSFKITEKVWSDKNLLLNFYWQLARNRWNLCLKWRLTLKSSRRRCFTFGKTLYTRFGESFLRSINTPCSRGFEFSNFTSQAHNMLLAATLYCCAAAECSVEVNGVETTRWNGATTAWTT